MAGILIRDVVERHHNTGPSSAQQILADDLGGSSNTGFPVVQHRSKAISAFKRAKLDKRVQSDMRASKDRLESAQKLTDEAESLKRHRVNAKPAEDLMEDISRSNEAMVAKMSEDERAREREDIIDKFGNGIDDLMSKVREARKRRAAREATAAIHRTSPDNADSLGPSAPNSVPPSPHARAARKIRFAEPTEADVHVYESQPSSPKRLPALLPPPPEDAQERRDISSLGTFNSSFHPIGILERSPLPTSASEDGVTGSLEEGSPEDIRRRFFPTEALPEANRSLAWMLPSSTSSSKYIPSPHSNLTQTHDSAAGLPLEPRYSLSGARLSSSEISNLPTHLGLHHHASAASADTLAGYTLSDLLLLARSSVPAQRASILGVLAKILRITRKQMYGCGRPPNFPTQEDATASSGSPPGIDIDAMRRDVLDAAIDALGEKGGVGQRAVDALWEAIVGFGEVESGAVDLDQLTGVDFTPFSLPPTASSEPAPQNPTNFITSSHSTLHVLSSLPLVQLLPALKSHLLASPSPASRTHIQVLDILHVFSFFSHHARTIVSPEKGAGVIAALVGPHLQPSYIADEDHADTRATTKSIRILQTLARSDRDNALNLTGPADVLLRYVTALLPSLTPSEPQSDVLPSSHHSLVLLEETLRFYALLSQYGLYAQVASTAQDHFARIGAWLFETLHIVAKPHLTTLTRAYLSLLEVWMVCATDPHRTTPSHDILWSQVQGWNWGEWTLDLAELLASTSGPMSPSDTSGLYIWTPADGLSAGLWTSICQTAAVWLEGAAVNGMKGGEAERMQALSTLGPLFERSQGVTPFLRSAIAALQCWELPRSLEVQKIDSLRDLATATGLLAAVLRLALALFGPGSLEQPIDLLADDIREVCARFIDDGFSPYNLVFCELDEADVPQIAHTFLRPVSALLVRQLQFWRRSTVRVGIDTEGDVTALGEEWISQALRTLGILLPGDEDYATQVVELLCDNIDAAFIQKVLPSIHIPHEFWDKDGIKVLLPFLTHSLRLLNTTTSAKTSIAPISANPESIARCTTLNLPSFSRLRSSLKSIEESFALPLRHDWPTLPLNHLLRSGSSPVLQALPPSWDATETDVVRASLLLARIVQAVQGKGSSKIPRQLGMSRAEAVFLCMKVFMLEHGQQQSDSGDEVFRDPLITQWMEDLLQPFTFGNPLHVHSYENEDKHRSSLEYVSKAFLGAGTPFYQFYTDFLALYDAISFSHPLFGRLLLPPVSMSYPIDYRRLLFGDFGHVLRALKTAVQDVICEDIRHYLWPIEHDARVIGWYLKALVTSDLQGFVRWLAVHHVAANIWPEFRDGGAGSEERAGNLLSAVLQQGSLDIVKEIVLYRQLKEEFWLPPHCFMVGERAWRERRLEWINRISGPQTKAQVRNLLLEIP